MKANSKEHLNCFLCKHSLPEWSEAIQNNAQILHFKKGQLIFEEGSEAKGFYFLHSGKVKIHKKWGTDKELIVKFAKEGEILGHRGIGAQQQYPVSATALDNIEVCYVSTDFLKTTLKVNNELTYELMLYYAHELQEAELTMSNMVHMNVKSRIAGSLLRIQDIFGVNEEGYINSTLTRQDISSYAGTTYETVFKTFNEFISEGIVETSGKNIRIKKIDVLKAIANIGSNV
jgi:CRP-like cAMP-binding protein